MVPFEPFVLLGGVIVVVGLKIHESRKRHMTRILKEDTKKRTHCIEVIGWTEADLKALKALDEDYRKKQWKESRCKGTFMKQALKEDPPSIALILHGNSKSLVEGPPAYESLAPAYHEIMKQAGPEHRIRIVS
eukprot:Clim_evm130s109 gene=Clim_evmTU130s109